jgi:glutamate dehydrogenase
MVPNARTRHPNRPPIAMTVDAPAPHRQLLARLEALVRQRFPPGEAGIPLRFLRLYYARTRTDVLETRDPLDLYGAALAHLRLARRRPAGETLVRVYNPSLEKDGWECAHTVIEVVMDDMPFLVDSVRMAVNRHRLRVLRIIHPILRLRRDREGRLVEVLERDGPADARAGHAGRREAVMHFEILRQSDPLRLRDLESEILGVLTDVRLAVEDWGPMRDALAGLVAEIEAHPPPLDPAEVAESLAFLRWLADDHFTFLGYRVYELAGEEGEETLGIVPGTGMGILQERDNAGESRAFASLPPELRAHARRAELLVLTKANARATVHRDTNLDYVGVKRFDAEGRVRGEHRFLGLYGSRAYNCLPGEIPLLRRKLARVVERADLEPDSHSAKALVHVLETYPRDELFQIGEEDLFRIGTGIMELAEEQRPRLFMREDLYGRFVTCLVYVPRERYDTQTRIRMQGILEEALNATQVEFAVNLTESLLARILFTVRTQPGRIPAYEPTEIEARLVETIQSWEDRLLEALLGHLGEERGNALFEAYGGAFPAGYREDFPARTAVRDIEHMEQLSAGEELRMSLYAPLESPTGRLRFKVFRFARTLPLSQVLPMLENMGVAVEDERPYRVGRLGSPPLWVHDFGLAYEGARSPAWGDVRKLFQDCFAMVWRGLVQDDGFNRLVIGARLDWRRTALIRAYAKYLRQTGMTFSQTYIEEAVAGNPTVAAMLVELFEVRFDPGRRPQTSQQATRLIGRIQEALDEVASLDQDRILRSLLAALQATLRTNWYQVDADGQPKAYTAFKLRSREIPDLPEPRPAFEIFVYSPQMEGVHLRGGMVARGGLRWSDRREDFRTEVLGLMKAQMVKNAIIVPVGAKGGFVVKHPPAEPARLREAVLGCYRQFVSGLLDVTDNLVAGRCLPPPNLIRYDGDDPYLVVAADKGTASLSDTANAVAADYGFWLGDAFASGGASGYDHKAMGITARGVWECVRQHFQAAEIAHQREPFTVVGIGDMSGDVFGNGMLFSDKIKLIAAFDHRHVFIDPDPDPAASFAERRRLFTLPGSSWSDYDPEVISEGGGVFPRSLKSIRLSARARAALGTGSEAMTPAELVRVILRAPVDLLFNGGIGTYVRAVGERDSDVGDRGNDALRVTAASLRCRVVAEGGNLGLTQPARVELARRGGRVDTDFIHNAGGVSCSDHEVNIKVLLDQAVSDGDLTLKQRNSLLADMTDEVARLVLQDCYWQGRAIGLDELRAPALLTEQARFMRTLEQRGELSRVLEHLPDDETLSEREAAAEGLARPEIAVLISYAKQTLYQQLLDSDLPEDPCLAPELERYFPRPLRERFRERIHAHRLRREILAATIANRVVNRGGATFVFRFQEELGVSAADAVRACLVAWEVFRLRRLWSRVAELDAKVPDRLQVRMLAAGSRLTARASRWLLRYGSGRIRIDAGIERYRGPVDELAGRLPELVPHDHWTALDAAAAPLRDGGVPGELAVWVAGFDTLSRALDLVEAAEACDVEITAAAQVYFALDSALGLDWLAGRINALPTRDRWVAGARTAYRDDLLEHHRSLCTAVLTDGAGTTPPATRLETWRRRYRRQVDAWLGLLADIRSQDKPDLAMLSVALRAVHRLAAATASPVRAASPENL